MDKVCVVVPIYNVQQYLERCLNSIINQDYKNLQIILVDDGSTDLSLEICNKYRKMDSRIEVYHKENGGLSSARNVGIDNCKCKFICFIDSDDYIELDMISHLMKNMKLYDADISTCDILPFTNKKITCEMKNKINRKKEVIRCIDNKQALKEMINLNKIIYPNAVNKIYKIEIFKGNIRYPLGKLYEDMLVTAKLLFNSNKIVVSNKIKYFYFIREDSITNYRYSKKENDHIEMSNELLDFIFKNEKDLYKDFKIYHIINMISTCNKMIRANVEDNEKIVNQTQKNIRENKRNIIFSNNISFFKKMQIFIFLNEKIYKKIFIKLKG